MRGTKCPTQTRTLPLTVVPMATTSKWMATAASMWIQCSAGLSYTFGIYSPALKSSQSYDQSTLDTVATYKDIGANVGVLSGLLYSAVAASNHNRDRLPSSSSSQRGGPWVVHLAGAIQCFAGYFFLWVAVAGIIPRPPVPLTCLFMFLAAHGQTFFNTASVVTGVFNFPDYGGTIVGIMKGCFGLSGPMVIQLYQTICFNQPSTFLLILALLPTLVSLLLMHMVRVYPSNAVSDKKHLNCFSVAVLVIAAYLMIIIILENIVTFQKWARLLTFVILILVLASPFRIAIKVQKQDSEGLLRTHLNEKRPLLDDLDVKQGSGSSIEDVDEDKSILQAIRTGNFWLLFTAMACGMGSGLAAINNMSQIGESLGYKTVEINTLVSLWGIWNFLGRFGAGYVSDIFLHRRGWPRPLLMAFTLAIMSIGHMIIASGFPGNLYVGSIIVGISYGSQWLLLPTISSEIFGVRHLGTIFNTIATASPVGSYIFSVRVIGYFYDKEASGTNSCLGARCFRLSFFVLACVCIFGFFIALTMHFRTKRIYKVLKMRLEHSEKH